jgi:TolB protein
MDMKNFGKKCWLCALAFTAAAVITGLRAYAQDDEGPAHSVVFYSARDGQLNNQIYAMSPNGSDPIRVTYDTASDVDPDISPNGKEILFTSDLTPGGNKNIFLRDRHGLVRNLTNDTVTDEWARWSRDGRKIVFDSNRGSGVFEIFVMNRDGSGVTQLTAPPLLGRYPSWSPDGRQILYRRGIDIYAMNADGSGTPTQLTSEVAPSFAQMAVWSPDWRYIAFMSFRDGYCSVFRMNTDGSEQTNLTPKDPADPATTWCSRAPAWSTDGERILFMSSRPSTNGQNEIFDMDRDGRDVRQLTSDGTNGSPRARVGDE